jgi:Flp pilus assembly protein CpaB
VSLHTPLAVRARRAFVRPVVRRTLVTVVALVTGVAVASALRSADAARRGWGTARPVAVATRDLAVGDVVTAAATDVHDLPEAVVPPRALGLPPVGAVVRHPVVAGEPLVADRLAPLGLTGPAALVPAGSRALAVPVGPLGAPPLEVGDLVDLVGVLPPESGGSVGEPLASTVPVVAVDEGTATVAVPREDAPGVADALVQGAVVIALVGA